MPKCPCCRRQIEDFRGILFHDLERAVYIDDTKYQFYKPAYRALKAIYDHGPMTVQRLAITLFGEDSPDRRAHVRVAVSRARAVLSGARMQIDHLTPGGWLGNDQYKILEFPR